MDNKALLKWQLDSGVDETITDSANNYFAIKPSNNHSTIPIEKPTTKSIPLHLSPVAASNNARELANSANTLTELEAVVRAFDGCALKKTATKTVFSDGNPKSDIMIIGEAPDTHEDIQGIPLSGQNGQLFDKMLATIQLDRSKIYITNTIYWRTPANRPPNDIEITTCLPFLEKHIALIAPKLIILMGGTAANALLKKDASISKLRNKIYDYSNQYSDPIASPIKTLITFHPTYLLRTPSNKKLAWQDMLFIKKNLPNQAPEIVK